MAGHSTTAHVGSFQPSQRLKTLTFSFIGIGVLGFIVGLMQNQERLWTSYLTAYFYVSLFALGGMFWVAVNNIAKAGWSVGIRRIAEGFTSFFPVMLIGSLVLLAGGKKLFPWMNAEYLSQVALVQAKTAYLNVPFLVIRLLVFGLGTIFFAKKIVGNSLAQDKDGSEKYTLSNVGWSIGYVLFFALSFSLFSVDLLMSLLPTWYSTIYGVYTFAGMFQSTLALFILVLYAFKNSGTIKGYFTEEHIHDVAKFLKGFTVFWAYIAFSQFMLIWYANIPEETEFYLMRANGGWMAISMALLVLKFIVPFLALLPRWAKRDQKHLTLVCVLILIMQYVDIYWLVYPNFFDNHVTFGFYEVSMLLLFLGLFSLSFMKFFEKHSLVATKDPRLHEALNHHVTY